MDACRTCRGQFEIPEKSEKRKIRTSPMLFYTHPLPTTCSITICHTLKAMTLKVTAKVSRLAMTKEKALTVSQTETQSLTEMRALPQNRRLLCQTAHGCCVQSYRRSKDVLSGFFVPFDADDVCTDRIEAESRKKQLLLKLAIRIAPLGTKRKLEPAAGKLDHHTRLPPALCMRARSCRFICKAVVKIGWSCC